MGYLTAKELKELLDHEELEDFQIYIGRPVSTDELIIDFAKKRIEISGKLFHESEYKKLKQLRTDILDAFNRFLIQ